LILKDETAYLQHAQLHSAATIQKIGHGKSLEFQNSASVLEPHLLQQINVTFPHPIVPGSLSAEHRTVFAIAGM
jgi:hypothetical protein